MCATVCCDRCVVQLYIIYNKHCSLALAAATNHQARTLSKPTTEYCVSVQLYAVESPPVGGSSIQ